jgi:OOP family OmpA-OmpF porin
MRSKLMAGAATFALLACASAARAQDSGFYADADIAASRLHVDGVDDQNGTSYGLNAGYRVNRNFAVEGGYARLGDFGDQTSYKADALSLSAVGLLPLERSWALYGKAGFARTSAEVPGVTDDANGLVIGAGAMYDFTRQFYAKAGWDRYTKVGGADTGSGAVDVFGVGLGMRF